MLFLQGKNEEVIHALTEPMDAASKALEFERAAIYRDQINSLRRVQEKQFITSGKGDFDIVACAIKSDMACVQLFFIRGGRNLGNKVFYPTHVKGENESAVIDAFLKQYYLHKKRHNELPGEILLSHAPLDAETLADVLTDQEGKKIQLLSKLRSDRASWVKMARSNAEIALQQRISSNQTINDRFEALQLSLKLEDQVNRIECFDISHTGGEATVASCVVFGRDGAIKSDYRRYNIDGITRSDDYAAMRQAIERRYTRLKKEDAKLPELILIDGGKGQLHVAKEVMEELQLTDLLLVGVAKGSDRKPGLETLIRSDNAQSISLPANSSALHLIQEIRDEAHRFAITGHRQRRKNNRSKSPLETIEGIGSKRRQQLIKHFGGMQGVERAGIDDLAKVPGINKNLANKIYQSLHSD
jgi:excinuclease ABC subunit C